MLKLEDLSEIKFRNNEWNDQVSSTRFKNYLKCNLRTSKIISLKFNVLWKISVTKIFLAVILELPH